MNEDSVASSRATKKRRRRWRPIHALLVRPRFSIAMAVALLAFGLLLISGMGPVHAFLLGFDLGTVVFLAGMLWLFSHTQPADMRRLAKIQDTGQLGVMWISIGLTAVVLVALSTELHASKNGGPWMLAVAGGSIVLSWLFMNIMYAQHYAHGYYGNYRDSRKGLDFPGTEQPDYWDFTYFSIILGMTFQVSDVSITSRYLRRVAMVHSLVAFFFNMFIIALSVNIVAGQA